jgi:hypothetical protein
MAARPKKSAIRNPLLYPLSYGRKVKLTEKVCILLCYVYACFPTLFLHRY